MPEIGDLISRYRIEEIIKRGGMSEVFKVKDMKLKTTWAMKVINLDSNMNDFAITESQIIKNARHPSLPRIVDIVRTDDSFCIIMDYIEGENLEDYVIKYGGLCEEEVIRIGKEILNVLDYFHSGRPKIIYRDLKPSNIMITKNKEIKLIDFGISGKADAKSPGYATRNFASPEQLKGGMTDERSDIYSLGASMKYILKDEASKGMNIFLSKCMQNNPKLRYKNAKEAFGALCEIRKINSQNEFEMNLFFKKIIFFLIMFFLSLSGLFLLEYAKRNLNKKIYEEWLKKTHDSSQAVRKEALTKLIVYDENADWIFLLFDEIKSDLVFDEKEEVLIEDLFSDRFAFLRSDSKYGELAKEIGRLYLFYSKDTESEKYKRAAKWFDESMEFGKDVYSYSKTAHFLSEIRPMILEGKDGGTYAKFFAGLENLTDEALFEESTVRMQIFILVCDSITAFSPDFLREGVTIDEMYDLLSLVEKNSKTDGKSGTQFEKQTEEFNEKLKTAWEEIEYLEREYDCVY